MSQKGEVLQICQTLMPWNLNVLIGVGGEEGRYISLPIFDKGRMAYVIIPQCFEYM